MLINLLRFESDPVQVSSESFNQVVKSISAATDNDFVSVDSSVSLRFATRIAADTLISARLHESIDAIKSNRGAQSLRHHVDVGDIEAISDALSVLADTHDLTHRISA